MEHGVGEGGELFQILSLDGGGIRGLFSAALLASLENDLGIRVADHFDLLVGTSTGGVIALGLGLGVSLREVLEFYRLEGPKIFSYQTRAKLLGRLTWGAKSIVRRRYSPDPLEAALKRVFGEKTLGDSVKRLVIPSFSLTSDNVYLFKTPHHPRLRRDWKVPAWQVARATSAAPTFFPASQGVEGQRLVDGGVWANNPSVVGIVEAVSMLGAPLGRIRVLSLGTTGTRNARPRSLDEGGLLQWAKTAPGLLLHAQACGANAQALHLVGPDNLIRVNPVVPANLFALDRADLRDLYALAADESRKFAPDFERKLAAHKALPYTPYHVRPEKETA